MLFLPVAAVTSLTRSGANLLTATKRPDSYVCQMYHSTPPKLTCRLTALFSIVSSSLTLVDPRLLCSKRLIAFPVSDHSTALEHGSGAKRLRHHVTCERFCSTAAPRLAAFGLEDCGHALIGDIYSTLIFIIFIVFFWRLACKM